MITIQDSLTAYIMTIQEGSRRHDDYTRGLDIIHIQEGLYSPYTHSLFSREQGMSVRTI